MIYTLALTSVLEVALADATRRAPIGAPRGSRCWATRAEADAARGDEFTVLSVDADWDADTDATEDEPFRRLTRGAAIRP